MLFVEKPRKGYGYRFYDAAIIEGDIEGVIIRVKGPAEFAKDNPVVEKNGFQQISEEAGPARFPTPSEHQGDCTAWRDKIIAQYAVPAPVIS